MPTCTVSVAQPMMLVVSRMRGSSSMATTATTNGGGYSADHCCTFVVWLCTVPRPDTACVSS